MTLGLSYPSLQSADNAIKIYRKIGRNNYNIAECLLTKANAYGQLYWHNEAIRSLNFSKALLIGKTSSAISKTHLLSHILVNMGKSTSQGGNAFLGKKILEKARSKAMVGNSPGLLATVDLRLAQHFTRNREFAKAESQLAKVQGLEKQLNTSEYAIFLRSVSEFCLRTEQWEEARCWCKKSLEFGRKHSMQVHIQHINDMIEELRKASQWDD